MQNDHTNKSRTIRVTDLAQVLFGNRLIQQKTTGTVPVVFCCLFHILDQNSTERKARMVVRI